MKVLDVGILDGVAKQKMVNAAKPGNKMAEEEMKKTKSK